MFVFGTRPEAIKMAPVIAKFKSDPSRYEVVVAVTAQHREMLDQVLDLFGIVPDHDLNIMKPNQSLADTTASAVKGLDGLMVEENPDLVFVQGDTTTTFVGALAAFYHKVPVAHIEAGLRTFDKFQPFPEEINRTLTSRIADINFAPTESSKNNLLREGVPPETVFVTGNTVIDALLDVAERPYDFGGELGEIFGNNDRRTILLTAHRRENHGKGMEDISRAVLRILKAHPETEILFPVHLSPHVRGPVFEILGGKERVHLIDPLDYEPFVHAMAHSYLILTDSGGVQEEAPSLGKPVLVLRNTTERPEAVDAGTVELVGTDVDRIVESASQLLDDPEKYEDMARNINPYGDGQASSRIFEIVGRS